MILVIDVGTTGLRSAIVRPDATVAAIEHLPFAPDSPFPGMVEFDATRMAQLVLEAAQTVLRRTGNPPVNGVGVTNQRATTIVWERTTGRPIGPAIGWQDLRTVGECLTAKAEHGLDLAPNQSATKIGWLLANCGDHDPADLCFGTVDSWVAWTLSDGALHVTDHTNAAITGLYSIERRGWHIENCQTLGIDPAMLPTIVDTIGVAGEATALPDGPPIGALAGDQQASLVGQGCVTPGHAKFTFGTGGMLDMTTGPDVPASAARSENGTFPIVAWTQDGSVTWGVEAIMLSAGSNVEWLRDDLQLIASSKESHDVAAACETADGVVYVPALLGLGTPHWDYGARGTLLGITRGTERAHVVRAVLEGIAHRSADMVEAAEADTGLTIPSLRVDGGMSGNPTFVQAIADATRKPVEVSPTVDATTVGAGLMAGTAVGEWPDVETAAATFTPASVVEPAGELDRDAWRAAVERSAGWIPELSALDF
ncbi:MAG: FGGY family carbohydrate kinase [Ilumatobacter sp.]|uniref:FGGY family carbohydrate kinase n=1 Tax=Ilumatobacter sp. TaxID=1967498 RepID=UPI002610EB4B|nr:FGGY family carbohydrate kinase [Ilumatobacter sp.]MDJ0767874.1 FGGY family carbohydrate kinase [Ilumatobacter sp.]